VGVALAHPAEARVEANALRDDGFIRLGCPTASSSHPLTCGVDRYGSLPVAKDIWFDDVDVDRARIGCAR
jgi:hypothetical protein